MVSIPFALSVSHFISTVGAAAGFAAIIGLALLVLLFVAQMRETAGLREQAAAGADRVAQLEQRLSSLAHGMASGQTPPATGARAPVVAPRPASAGAPAPAPAAMAGSTARAVDAPAEIPAAPAGVGAPALASATRLIPGFDEGPISVRQAGVAAAAQQGGSGGGPSGGGGRPGAAVMDPPGPPPATAAGGGNGTGGARLAPVGAGAGAVRGGQAARPGTRGNGNRPPTPPASRRTHGSPPGGRLRGFGVVLVALAVVAAIVVALLLLTGGGGSTSPSSASSTAASSGASTRHRASRRAATIKPSSVSVVVLNGTSTANLAHDISVKLAGTGYRLGTPATATDQTHAATIVGYLPGHRAAAAVVAKSLGLGMGAVSAVDQSSQAVACPQGTPCTAQVIVTAGADLASVASSSATAPAAGATSTG